MLKYAKTKTREERLTERAFSVLDETASKSVQRRIGYWLIEDKKGTHWIKKNYSKT